MNNLYTLFTVALMTSAVVNAQVFCENNDCCGLGTIWDADSGTCQVKYPADANLDNCVGVDDLLTVLLFYSDCYIETENSSSCDNVSSVFYHEREYDVFEIAGECWFQENLATWLYNNGDSIHVEPDGEAFCVLEVGSVCSYNFSDYAEDTYGLIYNFMATDDERGLCPSGWHVASEADFAALIQFVGGSDSASYHLRGSPELWNGGFLCPDTYGFGGLPGGNRDGYYGHGHFDYLGWGASFWVAEAGYKHFHLGHSEYGGVHSNAVMTAGHYVRCVKD